MRGKVLFLLWRPDARTGRAPRPTAAAALTRRSCRPTMFCIKFFRFNFFLSSSISFTLFFSERWQDCLTCEWGAGLNGNGKVGWGSNEGTEVKCHFYSERYVPPSNRLLVQKEMFVRSKFTAITLSLFIVMCLLGLLALISVSLNVIKAQEGLKICELNHLVAYILPLNMRGKYCHSWLRLIEFLCQTSSLIIEGKGHVVANVLCAYCQPGSSCGS